VSALHGQVHRSFAPLRMTKSRFLHAPSLALQLGRNDTVGWEKQIPFDFAQGRLYAHPRR